MKNDINLKLRFNKVFALENNIFLEKYLAHKIGQKHLAFSLFLFNNEGNLLLQKRSSAKIFPNLWTNTCCSHPVLKYNNVLQVNTRLFQEFGFFINRKNIYKIFSIAYQAVCNETNFIENEIDDVYIGFCEKKDLLENNINSTEISDFKWVNFAEISSEINTTDEVFLQNTYTPWFIKIIKEKSIEISTALKSLKKH